MQTNKLLLPGALCAALTVAGCGTTPLGSGDAGQAQAKPAYTSVLAYPDRLVPNADGSGALSWVEPGVDFGKYNKILLERISVRLADDAAYSVIDPTEMKALTDYFHQAIVKALEPAYPVVTTPGRDVLRVRIAITDLVPTKTEYSVVTLVVPYATVADMASGAATGGPVGSAPYLGRTGLAAELIDSDTKRVVGEYADTEIGRKYVVDASKGVTTAVTTGVTDYLDAYQSWAYAKQAFDRWAALFRQRLDELHGR